MDSFEYPVGKLREALNLPFSGTLSYSSKKII
jgi:hypothetical protein